MKLRLLYLDEVRIKSEVNTEVTVLQINVPYLDSTAHDRIPFMITYEAIQKCKIPKEGVPLYIGHDHRDLVGRLANFRYNRFTKSLKADLEILPKKKSTFLRFIQRGWDGISLELKTLEERSKHLYRVLGLEITGAALVDKPACRICKIKRERR